ncbi:MAG: UDP-N-acetylmuramoyl-L-alanyl-D-glutamate--2,6-diaminopimelate ligase [Clostridia bacterium]|nr:UDP-N-acetylmuramoyl-L-alanyl-D-glutamate--2,6-diaminopimelate ligase [Clostridia bacterium]
MKLCDLVEIKGEHPQKNTEIKRICIDSRKCSEGSIFVCYRGGRLDSHAFASDAYERGARVFISEHPLAVPSDSLVIISKKPRKTAAELSVKLYGELQRSMRFIGITGTKGKSSVALMLSHILGRCGIRHAVVGTLGVLGLGEPIPLSNTTPDAVELYPILKRIKDSMIGVVIMEVSSQALRDSRLHTLRFDTVVFTSFGVDHIGELEHPSEGDYLSSKRRLFTEYSAELAVVNSDDAHAEFLTRGVKRRVMCSIGGAADFSAERIRQRRDKTLFTLRGYEYAISVLGRHNVMNSLIAVAVAESAFGIDFRAALATLSDVTLPGRFEVHDTRRSKFIIDYAHNYMSVTAASRAAREAFGGRQIFVIGSVGGRAFGRRRELARAAEESSDFTVISSDNPGFEPAISICAEIYSHFSDKTRAKVIVDREEAIKYAHSIASRGDIIMLFGKGHEEYQRVRGEDIPFSERSIIRSLDKPSRL